MAAILINGPRPFVQIFKISPINRRLQEKSEENFPGISEEKLFKGVDGRTTDEEWSAQGS